MSPLADDHLAGNAHSPNQDTGTPEPPALDRVSLDQRNPHLFGTTLRDNLRLARPGRYRRGAD